MRFFSSFLGGSLFLLTLALPLCAQAETLYAVDGASNNPSSLYILDATDGSVVQTIGAIGFNHVVAIAFDPTTGTLYGHANDFCDFHDGGLITIDPATGAGTLVGCTGCQIPDFSFDSTGTLFGWAEFCASGVAADDLVTIDLNSGAVSKVGEASTNTLQTGLAFDSAESLFMKSESELYDVDPATGATTFLINLSESTQNMLAFDASDVLYTGTRGTGFTLQTVDINTGAVTDLGGNDNDRIAGLAFQPAVTAIEVAIDIKFCSDPNAFNCKKKGVLPVTIFGTDDFDVSDIDPSSLRLCLEDLSACTNGPTDWSLADRGDPLSDIGAAMCAVVEIDDGVFEEQDYLTQDGLLDLDAAFDAKEIQDVLGDFCGAGKDVVSGALVIIGSTEDGADIFSVPVDSLGVDQLLKVNR